MLGNVLQKARENAGLTQEDLAHRAGIDRSYLSQLENDRKSPTVETLRRLALALGVPAWKLLKTAEERAPTH